MHPDRCGFVEWCWYQGGVIREVDRLKALIFFRSMTSKPARVSFSGMARLLVSMDELERSIEEAKAVTFRYGL